MILLILPYDIIDDVNDVAIDETKPIKTAVIIIGLKGLVKHVESFNELYGCNVKLSFGLTLFACVTQVVPWFDQQIPEIVIYQPAITFLEAFLDKAEKILSESLLGGVMYMNLNEVKKVQDEDRRFYRLF